jgi:hypothetical protein
MRKISIVAAPLLACAALSLALAWAGRGGWKGEINPCVARDGCYCEEFREGPIRQPSNSWSCLAFVLAGLLCALHASKKPDSEGGRLASTALHPAAFATGLALIGPASVALHATMTKWGGQVDGSSMDFFISYCLGLGLARRHGWDDRKLWAFVIPLTLTMVSLKFLPGYPIRGEFVFGCVVAAFALNELLPEDARTRPAGRRWLYASAGFFAAGFSIWLMSVGSTSPMCRAFGAQTLFQGHAIWHCLTAAAAACLYPHLRQERRLEASLPVSAAELLPG